MQSQFDYQTLWRILGHVGTAGPLLRFCDLGEVLPERFVLLRHDVDYSPAAALSLAEREAERGIRASYFVLTNSPYYNLLDPEHAGFPRRLVELGHEVGLHYDARFLRAFPEARWGDLLERQAELLGELSGVAVATIAMHQPALNGTDPFARSRFRNAYDDRFFRDAEYVSDSCRAWRDRGWDLVTGGPVPPRLQLALHPVNWSERDRPRRAVFADVHDALQRRIGELGRELWARIAVHSGVVEHEARERRAAGPERVAEPAAVGERSGGERLEPTGPRGIA